MAAPTFPAHLNLSSGNVTGMKHCANSHRFYFFWESHICGKGASHEPQNFILVWRGPGGRHLLLVAGCSAALTPQVSYQGRLTDDTGNPLNGTYQLDFALYHQSSGGTAIYSETDSVAVTDGLFDTVVGPGSAVAGLTPEDLAQPLWLEVTVSNGTITETLTPRQRLYGSPYAFTLMPGAVISSTMNTNLFAPNGINGVVSVHNSYDGDT